MLTTQAGQQMTLDNIEYTQTFTEDELILVVQCLQAEARKIHQAFNANNPNITGDYPNPSPMHSALMIRMMEERTKTIVKVREQENSRDKS